MKNLIYFTFYLFSFLVVGQKFEIKGVLVDSLSNAPIQSATVYLESKRDTTLISYSITDADGAFILLGNTGYKKATFLTSYQGYKEIKKEIDLTQQRNIDFGTLLLPTEVELLNGVVLNARKAPITVKKDTLEFNAKSFKTSDDANLEELLKELPGVEITKDGTIRINGKEVKSILVNGKEFFGDDPQIALKNLPQEIIDKIQVTDLKTDEQKLTGEDGSPNESEINIVLDEDKSKGWFSRLTAGAGTQDRYSTSGILNYFKDDLRVSVLASSNNINSPGFSFDEVYDAMGNSAYSISRSSDGSFGINGINFGGGNNGITSSRSTGLNMADDWGEKLGFSGSYFFAQNDTETATDSRSITFLPNQTQFITQGSNRGNNAGISHRVDLDFEIKPDTLTTIGIKPSINFNRLENRSASSSQSLDEVGNLINDVDINNNSSTDQSEGGLNMYLYKRFKKKGNYLSINVDLDQTRSNNESSLFSQTVTAADPSPVIQDQLITEQTQNQQISSSIRWGKRIDDDWSLTFSYRLKNRNQTQDRDVFDRDTGGAPVFITGLSNEFEAVNVERRPAIGVNMRKDRFRFSVTGGLINQQLTTKDLSPDTGQGNQLDTSFEKSFNNAYASAFVSKQFGKYGSLYLNYDINSVVPSVRQLQPVDDRTNPQNIIAGNPDLDAQIRHQVYLNLNNYNWEKESGFFSGLGFTYSDNAVASISVTNADLLRLTSFVNVDGVYDGYFYLGWGKGFTKDKRTFSFDLGFNGNFARRKSFSNAVAFTSNSLNMSPDVGISYKIQDLFDVEVGYNISFNNTNYSIASIPDQEFVNQTASIDLTAYWPKNVTIGFRGEYNVFGNVTSEFDNDAFVLISSLGYTFAKEKAVLKLKAYDLLNQVINTRRSISQDVVSDRTNLVLQQYFMLSFTYKFSKFGGKDPNK